MTELKYMLLPVWRFHNGDDVDFDIPPYFIKLFSSKKEIEEYMTTNDPTRELMKIKDDEFYDKIQRNNITGDDRIKMLSKALSYKLSFWVIGINPVGKENRIAIVQQEYDRKKKCLVWKCRSYFGGKVWKDNLLMGIYR